MEGILHIIGAGPGDRLQRIRMSLPIPEALLAPELHFK